MMMRRDVIFLRTKGFRIYQWGYGEGVEKTALYITTMKAGDLTRAVIDRWTRDNREGYQRATKESRFIPTGKKSIVSYLMREVGVFPTSVLLNVRGSLEFNPTMKVTDFMELGDITIPDDERLWIIDGQHRIGALQRSMHAKPELKEYPVPVTLTNFDDKFDEMLNFYIVNSRQTKIPTDLVFRHLQTMMEKSVLEDKKWLSVAILGEKEERAAMATIIVDFLEEDDSSPFKGKIQFTGEPREDHHLVKDYSLSTRILKILNERAFSQMDGMVLAEKISDYWSVLKGLYPLSFINPRTHTLLKTTGLGTYTNLFPSIFAMCASDGEVTEERFKFYLEMLKERIDNDRIGSEFLGPIDDNWWSSAHGPAISKATTEQMISLITKNMAMKINIVKASRK